MHKLKCIDYCFHLLLRDVVVNYAEFFEVYVLEVLNQGLWQVRSL